MHQHQQQRPHHRLPLPPIKNLVDADIEVIRAAMKSELPHIFFCQRKRNMDMPAALVSLHKAGLPQEPSMQVAMLNCSQEFSNDLSIWDRLKLKREWRPSVFGTAPWLPRPLQFPTTAFADHDKLRRYVTSQLRPKSLTIKSEQHLRSYCSFGSAKSTEDTCFVVSEFSSFDDVLIILM